MAKIAKQATTSHPQSGIRTVELLHEVLPASGTSKRPPERHRLPTITSINAFVSDVSWGSIPPVGEERLIVGTLLGHDRQVAVTVDGIAPNLKREHESRDEHGLVNHRLPRRYARVVGQRIRVDRWFARSSEQLPSELLHPSPGRRWERAPTT